MTIGRKLAFVLILGVAVILAGNAYLRIIQEIGRLGNDQVQDQSKQLRILAAAVERVWGGDGDAFARRVVEEMRVAGEEPRVAWIWMDDLVAGGQLDAAALATLDAGEQVSLLRADGEWRRYGYVPISIPDSRPAVLELSEPVSPPASYVRLRILQSSLMSLLVLALCAVLVQLVVGWLVSRPLARVCDKARRVGEGDFSGRLDLSRSDEVGQLARDIDGMCDHLVEANARVAAETEARIATLEQLRHSDRLKTVGQLASGVAHELGTPLNVVLGRAKMITAAHSPTDGVQKNAEVIVEQTHRITAIIRQLLDFARREEPRVRLSSIDVLVMRAVEMLKPLAMQQGVALQVARTAASAESPVDEEQIVQVLSNLIVNGVQAMPNGGRLTVRVDRVRATPPIEHGGPVGEYVLVCVEDQGRGIPTSAVAHVFEPFFTTKDVGEGTGLGLSVAYGIVQDHHGWISVESTPDVGSRFLVYLPVAVAGASDSGVTAA